MSRLLGLIAKFPVLSAAALIVLFLAGWSVTRGSTSRQYRTAELARGSLAVDITATGTVQPEEVIDVGAQVAGQIVSFGKDNQGRPIDYGSLVQEGTVLAEIDQALYRSDVEQAAAQLKRSQADLTVAKAKLQQAERDWKRAQKVGPSEALAQSQFDAYQAAYETAVAQVAVADAQVAQAQASLERATRNLGYCTIRAPVSGVIIDRRVNIGQTVVSSLNTPSLFLIAKDLRKMQVWVSVNEADVGSIFPGQKVTFSVDAFPGESFEGEVIKTRLNASMTQNVVSYIVEVLTDNSTGRLLPYLTANVRFLGKRLENVLLVPNAALRYSPQQADAGARGSKEGGTIWVLDGKTPRAISVARGPSDGVNTQVEGAELKEGLTVITGETVDQTPQATNPFAPSMRRRG